MRRRPSRSGSCASRPGRGSAATASRSTRTTSRGGRASSTSSIASSRLAGDINLAMPRHVVDLVAEALNDRRPALHGAKVGVLGVAFKPNVQDDRNSPAAGGHRRPRRARRQTSGTTTRTSPRSAMPTASSATASTSPSLLDWADVIVVVTAHRADRLGRRSTRPPGSSSTPSNSLRPDTGLATARSCGSVPAGRVHGRHRSARPDGERAPAGARRATADRVPLLLDGRIRRADASGWPSPRSRPAGTSPSTRAGIAGCAPSRSGTATGSSGRRATGATSCRACAGRPPSLPGGDGAHRRRRAAAAASDDRGGPAPRPRTGVIGAGLPVPAARTLALVAAHPRVPLAADGLGDRPRRRRRAGRHLARDVGGFAAGPRSDAPPARRPDDLRQPRHLHAVAEVRPPRAPGRGTCSNGPSGAGRVRADRCITVNDSYAELLEEQLARAAASRSS